MGSVSGARPFGGTRSRRGVAVCTGRSWTCIKSCCSACHAQLPGQVLGPSEATFDTLANGGQGHLLLGVSAGSMTCPDSGRHGAQAMGTPCHASASVLSHLPRSCHRNKRDDGRGRMETRPVTNARQEASGGTSGRPSLLIHRFQSPPCESPALRHLLSTLLNIVTPRRPTC